MFLGLTSKGKIKDVYKSEKEGDKKNDEKDAIEGRVIMATLICFLYMAPFTFIAYINDWPFMKLFYWSFGTVISRLILWIFVDSVRQRMIKKGR